MEAMILAAGLGTRLRPLTEKIPKALIDVGGKPMIERVAERLISAGVTRLIINVHHHANQLVEFLDDVDNFGIDVRISYEPDRALETGGGLKHAEEHFSRRSPFFIHNADIHTNINLEELYRAHVQSNALATLAVVNARSTRYLIFDGKDDLCGYSDRDGTEHVVREPTGETQRLDFSGVHVVSPRIFDLMNETGAYSIINTYLRLSKAGEHIRPHHVDGVTWIDVGKLDRLEEVRAMFEQPPL